MAEGEKENKYDFSTTLKRLRKENDLTQQELADALDISKMTVCNWECDRSEPTVDTLIQLSDYFHVTVDELLTGSYKIANLAAGIKHKSEIEEFKEDLDYYNLNDEQIRQLKAEAFKMHRESMPECEQSIFPLFLNHLDPEYEPMRMKVKILAKLKREGKYTYEDILKYLNTLHTDYDEHINLAYLFMLFAGDKSPSPKFYKVLYDYLSVPKKNRQ